MARGSLMPRMALVVLVFLMGTTMHDFVAWSLRGSMTGSGLREGTRTRRQQSPRQWELPKPLLRSVEGARSELEAIFQELSKHLPREELKQLADLRQHWDGQLRVLLIGDFSSGKSTLMNVLAGKVVAETGPMPTTTDLHKHSCGKYKNIVLVDSPGINAAEGQKHKEQVLEDVKRADYVLFVMKATSPGTDSEAALRDLLSKYDTPGILVLSHWDGVDSEDRKNVEGHARNFAARAFPEKNTELFFINGKEAEKAIKCGKQHSETGCMKLESFLQEKLTDKAVQLSHKLNTFRSQGQDVVVKRLNHIQSSKEQARAGHQCNVDRLMQTEAELSKRIQQLSEERRRWDEEQKEWNMREEEDTKYQEAHLREREDETRKDGGVFGGFLARGAQGAAVGSAFGGPGGAIFGGILGGALGAFGGQDSKKEKERVEEKAAERLQATKERYAERKGKVEAEINELKGQLEMNKKKQSETQSDRRAAKGKFEQKMEALSQEEHALDGLLRRLHAWEPAKEF